MIKQHEILLANVETRSDQIYVTIYNEKYFKFDMFDDHNVIYNINDDRFYQQFKKTKKIKGAYNNEYTPKYFKTENECLQFLKNIGIEEV